MRPLRQILALLLLVTTACQEPTSYEVLVVGGSTSGTAAAISSARTGAHTLLIEEQSWLGGMLTAAGVSATDGNYRLRGGFWGEFRDSLEAHYGGAEALKTGWVSNILFEPHVGNQIFQRMAAAEPQLHIRFNTTLKSIRYCADKGVWQVEICGPEEEEHLTAKVVIDCTELGDVAARLGVGYDVGMDSATQTGEAIAPLEANDIIQDLTYVAILQEYEHEATIPRPEGYDPATYACCCQNARCIDPKEPHRMWPQEMMLSYGRLPNGKWMINWPIEGNDCYLNLVELTPEERNVQLQRAKNHTLGMLYFLQTELGYRHLGLAPEFPTADSLPLIPYHRESRRIHGRVRFTLNHILDPYRYTLYRTAIAVGDYPIDQHHTRYDGWAELPDLHFHPIPPYGIPLGVMLPREQTGLIVAEKSISVSNLVNGSTRLQPVVLQLGEAAGILAALSIEQSCAPHQVAVREVQHKILERGGYLLPLCDVPATHPDFQPLQRIATTGILPLRGEHLGWENLAWMDIEKPIEQGVLSRNLHGLYPEVEVSTSSEAVTAEGLKQLLLASGRCTKEELLEGYHALHIDPTAETPLTRGEIARVIDNVLDPFAMDITLTGEFCSPKN